MPQKLASILPWIMVGVLFLSVKLHWLPDYYSYLLTSMLCLFAFGFSWGIVGNSEKIPVKNWDGISDSTCSFPCSLQ